MKKKRILGMILGLVSMATAWYFYGFALVVVIFLALFGNNLEQNKR